MPLPSVIHGPTDRTLPGSFPEDPESQTALEFPVVNPPQAVSDSMDIHRGLIRFVHTYLILSRTVERICSMIKASFRLLVVTLQLLNRLGKSPDIRPGLLTAITTSILITASCILHFSHANYIASFTVLVVAIHPLVYLLNFVTDHLAIRYGETIACLLHANTMNAVEFIVAVVGLIRNQPQAVKASLLGSLVVKRFLIPGLCFFFGGLHFSDQHFNRTIPHSKSPMVILGFIAFILPSTLDPVHSIKEKLNEEQSEAPHSHLLDRIISIIMLLTYVGYTLSQLLLEPRWGRSIAVGDNAADASVNASSLNEDIFLESGVLEEQNFGSERISAVIAIIILFGICGLLVITTVVLDDSLGLMTANSLLSKWFVGFILSPLVANMPDAIAAVTASINGKPYWDLTVSEALSTQMTSFTIPLVTVTAWGMGKSFGFSFDLFESSVLALSVILTLVLHNEKGTSLKGMILMSTYLVVATTSWFKRCGTQLTPSLHRDK